MAVLDCTLDQLSAGIDKSLKEDFSEELDRVKEQLAEGREKINELEHILADLLSVHADFKLGIKTLGELLQAGKDAARMGEIEVYGL